MVSLRRFQELFKMLNCSAQQQQTTVIGVEITKTESLENPKRMATAPPRSASQLQPPAQNCSSFGTQQHRQRKVMSQSLQRTKYLNSDREMNHAPNIGASHYISRPSTNNSPNASCYPSHNKNQMTIKTASNRIPGHQYIKSNDNAQFASSGNKRNLSMLYQERALKILNRERNQEMKTPNTKEGNKFSRYLPLPAINSSGDTATEMSASLDSCHDKAAEFPRRNFNFHNKNYSDFVSELKLARKDSKPKLMSRNLTRQLTYKVINPLYVRGPLDSEQADFKKLQNQVNKRSKTIVIKSHQMKRPQMNEVQSSPIAKFSKEVHSKRLVVRKELLEAAEKIKEGEMIADNAFWVQF